MNAVLTTKMPYKKAYVFTCSFYFAGNKKSDY